MASATCYFDHIIARCREICTNVHLLIRDERPARALLRVSAKHDAYELHISDIVLPGGERKYAYYVLRDGEVIAGFDNAPDPEALRLKYGSQYSQHRLELIPHQHGTGKNSVSLTKILDFDQFLVWIEVTVTEYSPRATPRAPGD